MKKVSIIILLTALILGAFTACNGDVFSDLMPEPEPTPKRTITLKIRSTWEGLSFDDTEDIKTKELEIPEDCETWADYLEEVIDIKVYDTYWPEPFTLMVRNEDNKVYFCRWIESDSEYYPYYGLQLEGPKVPDIPESIEANKNIESGETYVLTAGAM